MDGAVSSSGILHLRIIFPKNRDCVQKKNWKLEKMVMTAFFMNIQYIETLYI